MESISARSHISLATFGDVLSAQSTPNESKEHIADTISVVNGGTDERKRERHGDESSNSVDDSPKNFRRRANLREASKSANMHYSELEVKLWVTERKVRDYKELDSVQWTKIVVSWGELQILLSNLISGTKFGYV